MFFSLIFFEKNSQMTCWSRRVIWRLYNFWLRKAPTSIKWIIRSKHPFGLLSMYGFVVFLFLFFLSFVCVCVFCLFNSKHSMRCRVNISKLPSSYWRMTQTLIIQTVIWLFFATLVKYASLCLYLWIRRNNFSHRKQKTKLHELVQLMIEKGADVNQLYDSDVISLCGVWLVIELMFSLYVSLISYFYPKNQRTGISK